MGRFDEALDMLVEIVPITEAMATSNPLFHGFVLKLRGQALLGKGRRQMAQVVLASALKLIRKQPGPSLELADTLWSLVRARQSAEGSVDTDTRALASEAKGIFTDRGQSEKALQIDHWLAAESEGAAGANNHHRARP